MLVLDEVPTEDECNELAEELLDDFPAESVAVSFDIVYAAPDFMNISEQDQINAYLRDGSACVLVVYMADADDMDDEEDF